MQLAFRLTAPKPRQPEPPAARCTDPDTSHEAAAIPRSQQRAAVFEAFRELGTATDYEISVHLGINRCSAGKRRVELQRDGWIAATDERRPTDTGARAIVWRFVERAG
jgi:hypothetical protein